MLNELTPEELLLYKENYVFRAIVDRGQQPNIHDIALLCSTLNAHHEPETLTESEIQGRVRLAASKRGIRLWRNNSGVAVGHNGRQVRYGLCNDSKKVNTFIKSSDLIGIRPDGKFIAREVKASDWVYRGTEREKAQKNFIDLVNSMGGDARFCTTEDCFE